MLSVYPAVAETDWKTSGNGSKNQQPHVVLDLHDVDVSRILSETVSAFSNKVEWQAPHAPVIITADETRLQVLFRNVIGNALQHGKHQANDEADVSVQLRQEQNEICIVVSDKGPGVGAEQLAKIGEPFYRTDESRTRKTGGIGLGLYLSKRTAEAHGGSLEIENQSQKDTGLRVTIRLPGTKH